MFASRSIIAPVFVWAIILGGLAQNVPGQGAYIEVTVPKALFATDEVELLEVDRKKLATNIAAHVINSVTPDSNARQMENARKFLGLALHMDPRNRTAVVANAQLSRGVAPRKVTPEYSPATLAELLQAKAGTLRRKGGDLNLMLAGYMLYAASEIDAANETAVYELEMYRKDIAEVDWTPVIGRGRASSGRK